MNVNRVNGEKVTVWTTANIPKDLDNLKPQRVDDRVIADPHELAPPVTA